MLQAIFLGLVQGFTEFLPVSSSGHLVFLQQLISFDYGATFDIMVHLGTLFAVVFFFWNKIITLSRQYLAKILLASIPAAVIGLFLYPMLEQLFSSLIIVFVGFSFTTLILIFSRKKPSRSRPLSTKTSFLIGLAQALAIVPGISRSGSTISAGLVQGIKQEEAFTFSFLLSLPAIIGATILGLKDVSWSRELTSIYLLGAIAAFASGLIALRWLKQIMQRSTLSNFAYYTGAMAILTLILIL